MARIRIHGELCKSCKLCVGACPKKIIRMDGDSLNSKGFHPAAPTSDNADKCTGCGFCYMMCPDSAIEVDK